MRRIVSVVFAFLLIVGVVVVVLLGRGHSGNPPQLTTVRGVIGSEKLPFFQDQRVAAAFARDGLKVLVDPAGSRQMTQVDLSKYDFAFPASAPTAQRLQRQLKTTTSYAPFATPMAVATFTPVVALLAKQGMAHRDPAGYWVLDIKAYLDAAQRGLRWDQIPGNTAYPARRNVLVTTTSPADSNSAEMYASVTSYVANGDAVVADQNQMRKVLDRVSRLFLDQGYMETTSEGPFESYLANGLSYAPMVWVYEAQYLGAVLRGNTVQRDMTLMYPSPTVLSTHTLVPISPTGDRVGRLLTTDPELGRLAVAFGFRTPDK